MASQQKKERKFLNLSPESSVVFPAGSIAKSGILSPESSVVFPAGSIAKSGILIPESSVVFPAGSIAKSGILIPESGVVRRITKLQATKKPKEMH